jgi:hypothetical protein
MTAAECACSPRGAWVYAILKAGYESTDVSEEHISSIFRIETKQEINIEQASSATRFNLLCCVARRRDVFRQNTTTPVSLRPLCGRDV